MRLNLMFVVLGAFMLMLASCGKEGCMNPLAENFDPEVINHCDDCCIYSSDTIDPELVIRWNHEFQGEEITPQSTFSLNGRKIQIASARFYLTNLVVGTTTFEMNEGYAFVDLGTTETNCGSIEVGNYQNISFDIGVNEADNHQVPNAFGTDHPLSPKVPSMFENVTLGHYFLDIYGEIDTSAVPDDIMDISFVVTLATDSFLTPIQLATTFGVPDGLFGAVTLNMTVDYYDIMNSIDIDGLMQNGASSSSDYPNIAASLPLAIGLQ